METGAEIRLFIAISLDGFIAREDGSVDWLDPFQEQDDSAYGYKEFYKAIDLILMGRKTYETILGFEIEWPYADRQTFVMSRQEGLKVSTPHTWQVSDELPDLVADLKHRARKGIWLVGGGQLATGLLNQGLIDEMILFVIPVMLGKGIRLFQGTKADKHFKLVSSDSSAKGVVTLVYRKKASE